MVAQTIVLSLALHLLVLPSVSWAESSHRQPADEDPSAEADRLANEITRDSANAKEAADVARQAAVVANSVAEHSVKVTTHAKTALKSALGALHEARVDSQGLDKSQKRSLRKAEAKLREATKVAKYGELKEVKDEGDLKREKMQADMDKKGKKATELETMRVEVRELREKVQKRGDTETDKELEEVEQEMLNKADKDGTNDEMKAEIERLKEQIEKLEQQEGQVEYDIPKNKRKVTHTLPESDKELMTDVKMQPLVKDEKQERVAVRRMQHEEATPVHETGIDIDTAMPYGDLEPFGREDTAQELTESSVKESDEMVDQLERAEVAEEKRSVFRALTRLRGAAITSFDGVARSQTGNIDEYNKVHKWRKTHPLHHLADEESDVTKWAFPDNADFVQVTGKEKDYIKVGRALLTYNADNDELIGKLTARALLQQDPCAGCDTGLAQAYQTCAMKHGNPCAETNAAGIVGSGPGQKKDIGCCMKKEKHDRCLQCKSMDCAHGTCKVNKKYYSTYTVAEKLDDKKAMKKAGWGK